MGLISEDAPGRSSAFIKIASIITALIVVAGLCAGYFLVRQKHNQQRVAAELQQQQAQKQVVRPPVLTIVENDPQIKGSQTILSGTTRNIGTAEMQGLVIEFELTRRLNPEKESKTTTIDKDLLAPNDEGKYQLAIASNTFRLVRVARVYLRQHPDVNLVFNSAQGTHRPKQAPPADFADAQPKRNRSQNGDDFLNSPDKPVSLP